MMDNWQFFLQKEGDYAWLPLETPQVEILEGRYQLVAHTSAAGSPVRVNIRHQFEQDNITQENIQESVRQTDATGKVEILPLVYLGLGSWSISCQISDADAASDVERIETRPQGLDIQVLPQDFDLFEDWNFDVPDPGAEAARAPALLPEEVSLADIVANAAGSEAEVAAVVSQTPTPAKNNVTPENAVLDSPSQVRAERLILPTFSADTPMVEFRTVSSLELPRLVSDNVPVTGHRSPQLPPFSRSRSVFQTKQEQRSGALSKMKFIASVVGCPAPVREVPRQVRREKFQTKLTRMAVGRQQ